jgi:hypothetical protein
MFRAFSFGGNIYIIRLCHLPTLSETIKLEDHRGTEFVPPNNNVKDFLRNVIDELHLDVSLTKPNGEVRTTTELGKEIIRVL